MLETKNYQVQLLNSSFNVMSLLIGSCDTISKFIEGVREQINWLELDGFYQTLIIS